ncbi:MAG TPA: hypothetical protein VMC08_11135 [Bacteroidales bacterium]|nr:hypothetical protein [Bacteroidales bacterium]
MMRRKSISVLWVIFLLMLGGGSADAQFVALARKIKSMHSSDVDVATVMLDANPSKVYKAVLDTLGTDPKCKITSRDPIKRMVEFYHGQQKVSMQVDSLATGFSQITVASAHVEDAPRQATDLATETILKVCRKAGIPCTVEPPKK